MRPDAEVKIMFLGSILTILTDAKDCNKRMQNTTLSEASWLFLLFSLAFI